MCPRIHFLCSLVASGRQKYHRSCVISFITSLLLYRSWVICAAIRCICADEWNKFFKPMKANSRAICLLFLISRSSFMESFFFYIWEALFFFSFFLDLLKCFHTIVFCWEVLLNWKGTARAGLLQEWSQRQAFSQHRREEQSCQHRYSPWA